MLLALVSPGKTADMAAAPPGVTQGPTSYAFSCEGRCAVTLLVGPQLTTGMGRVFGEGQKSWVPPWQYSYGNSVLVAGTVSYRLFGDRTVGSIEAEAGLGQRFGSLHQTEGWIALYFRWSYFPWNDYLRTSVAISTGLNYASSATAYEIEQTPGGSSTRLLHYLSPEMTFALPEFPDKQLVIRLSHRSGGGNTSNDLPFYGTLFQGNRGGTQYLTAGFRQLF